MLTTAGYLSAQQYGSFKDPRDGRVYKTVKIGSQVWMAENLNADRFRNGDPITEAFSFAQWRMAETNKKPAWCYYNNSPTEGKKYGRLYNWYAINDSRGLAPPGWHIPTDDEWEKLKIFLGDSDKLKSIKDWDEFQGGTNESGFTALPAGKRGSAFAQGATFIEIGKYTYWWSSTGSSFQIMPYGMMGLGSNISSEGISVRCIKN
jgi:uncharacterized protein (TIGR02145 family)